MGQMDDFSSMNHHDPANQRHLPVADTVGELLTCKCISLGLETYWKTSSRMSDIYPCYPRTTDFGVPGRSTYSGPPLDHGRSDRCCDEKVHRPLLSIPRHGHFTILCQGISKVLHLDRADPAVDETTDESERRPIAVRPRRWR